MQQFSMKTELFDFNGRKVINRLLLEGDLSYK